MAQTIGSYEAAHEVTSFSSKYDAVLGGKAQFTAQEQTGYDLFRGKAKCNQCHRDGGPGEEPLFTDFTASNIGTPANPRLPYYREGQPDARGYVTNPNGSSYVDPGVVGFLTSEHLLSQPSIADARWAPLAPQNRGRFQVPTLRNVDKRPDPGFVNYTHNGYFTSLKAIVHYYTPAIAATLQAERPSRRNWLLARAGKHGQHEQDQSRESRPFGSRRGCNRGLHADID